jgi:Flp pilus assembly protein TadG
MIITTTRQGRRGSVLPLVAMSAIALIGLLALAIDIGMIAIARSQCQNAADAAAMAGARTINGNVGTNYNFSAIPGQAVTTATANKVLNNYVQGDPTNITTVKSAPVPANCPTPTSYTDANSNFFVYTSGQVTVLIGTYAYVYNDATPSAEGFQQQIPGIVNTEPYSAVQVIVNGSGSFSFGRVFGLNTYNVTAQAVAVHRPRDVAIILDLSGSMRFQSLPGVALTNNDNWGNGGTFAAASSSNSPRVQSMNPDTVYPLFGHYSNTAAAALSGNTSYPANSGEIVDPSNISSDQNPGSAVVKDFYANAAGTNPSPSNVAFSYVTPSGTSAPPSGDNYLAKNGTSGTPPTTYGSTVQEITNGMVFRGYQPSPYYNYSGGTVANWSGFTQGPGYWGKTFFVWPPDPRGATKACTAANFANNGARDWRQRFFIKVNVANGNMGWCDHNSLLFNSAGAPATQSNPGGPAIVGRAGGNLTNDGGGSQVTVTEFGKSVTYVYRINYAAILFWLFDSTQTPNPFPSTLQGGRIRYYSSVPNYNDTTLNSRWWSADHGMSSSGSALADLSERFWKDYIDFVLGLQANGPGTYTRYQNGVPYSAFIGNGDFYKWGQAFQVSQKPDPPSASAYLFATSTVAYPKGTTSIVVNDLIDSPLVGDYVTFDGNTTNQYQVTSITPGAGPGPHTVTLNTGLVAGITTNKSAVSFYPYMSYADNPYRPRHQYWFGPMTMVDYLGNYNLSTGASGGPHHWWPGNCHEAHAWACKAGIQSAIADIQNNHPSDFVSLMFFSTPKYSASGVGHHNRSVIPMGRNYAGLTASLWFPPSTVTGGVAEITPYDSDMTETPRADGGTSPAMGFMLAYNQLSSSATNLRFYAKPSYQLPSNNTPNYRGDAGGLGRKGAVRLIIFETDGFPNTRSVSALFNGTNAGLAGSGADSYFPIRIGNPQNLSDSANNVEWPNGGSYADSEVYTIVQQITAQSTATPPGFSTSSRPLLIYCIGYGSIFDPNFPGAGQTHALTFLQTIQFYGSTSADTNPAHFPASQQIYGSPAQRVANMRTCLSNIMQAGVQVSLIK